MKVEDLDDVYKFFSAVYMLQAQAQALIDIAVKAAAALGMEVEGYIDAGVKLSAAVVKRIVRDGEYREVAKLAVKNSRGVTKTRSGSLTDVRRRPLRGLLSAAPCQRRTASRVAAGQPSSPSPSPAVWRL